VTQTASTKLAIFSIYGCHDYEKIMKTLVVVYFSQQVGKFRQVSVEERITMALETLPSNEFSNFMVYDTISATPFSSHDSSEASFLESFGNYQEHDPSLDNCSMRTRKRQASEPEGIDRKQNVVGVQGRKKRRRKPRVCKNKEEAETQRITHITVERNRRKQMNEHLAVLRSLMPESYVQRVCFGFLVFSFSVSIWFLFLSHNECSWDFFSKSLLCYGPIIVEMRRLMLSRTKLN